MTPRYMLDTDILSYASRGFGNAAEQIVSHPANELCVSVLTVAEIRYGATRRQSARTHRWLDWFTRTVAVMPFEERCATRFGEVAGDLALRGSLIGEFDLLIASHALTLDLTLVTNNERHFGRVPGLKLENWS